MKLFSTNRGRGRHRLPRFTFLLVILVLGLYGIAGDAPGSLVFDGAAVSHGEWWRLLTGHLVHSDPGHLLWNVAALVILGGMLERERPALLWVGLLAGMVAVDGGLWFGLPHLDRYCGLSGALNALLLLLLAHLWRTTGHPVVIAVAAASSIKLIVELWSNQALLTHTAWPSVPMAHLAGLCGGLSALLLWRFLASPSARVA